MASARFEITPAQLADLRRVLNPKQFQSACYQAIKRTVARARQIAAKAVQERLTIKRKYIDDPNNRSAPIKTFMRQGVPAGSLYINQVRAPMSAFKCRQTRYGVIVTLDKKRGSMTYRHAFLAKVRTKGLDDQHEGHIGVFERSDRAAPKVAAPGRELFQRSRAIVPGKLTKEGFAGRLHIDELFGPSVLQFITRDEIIQAIYTGIGNELEKQIDSQVSRFTKGKYSTLDSAVAAVVAADSSTDANA